MQHIADLIARSASGWAGDAGARLAPGQTSCRLGLIEHPRIHCWMLRGSHVENTRPLSDTLFSQLSVLTGGAHAARGKPMPDRRDCL